MWRPLLHSIIGTALLITTAQALQPAQINHIIVFGDSLSDAGYLNLLPRPAGKSATYTNGKVWTQYLATNLLNQTIMPNNINPIISPQDGGYADGKLNGTDYAAGGATTSGQGIIRWPGHYSPPSLQQQIKQFQVKNDDSGTINPKNLYIIWNGSNNLLRLYQQDDGSKLKFFFSVFSTASQTVDSLVKQVKYLHSLGAQHIIVIDFPDQGMAPLLNKSWFNRYFYQYLTSYTNSRLYSELTPHKLGFYVKVIKINEILRQIIQSPDQSITVADKKFQFDNIADAGCNFSPNDPDKLAISCIVPKEHEHYLFADQLHPTTYAHQLIASVIQQQILADNNL